MAINSSGPWCARSRAFRTCSASLLVFCAAAADPSLSPAAWDPAVFARMAALNAAPPRAQQMASGSGGLVAGTSNALAVYAGVYALEAGGTAMDACLATAIAEAVLCAGSYTSLGGIAHVVYVDAATGAATHFNGGWNTVRGNAAAAIPGAGVGAAMLVPGFWAALDAAARAHAAFSLATLAEPARYFAAAGFATYGELAALIRIYNTTLSRTPAGAALFVNPATRQPYAVGDNFTQPEVAAFLEAVQARGIGEVYNGTWATAAVETLTAWGSNITAADMAAYAPIVQPARAVEYGPPARRATVLTTAAPELGGLSLAEALLLMTAAGFSTGGMQPFPVNGTAMFWLVQITRWAALSSDVASCPGGVAALERTFSPFKFDEASRGDPSRAEQVWDFITAPGGTAAVAAGFSAIFDGKGAPWHTRGPHHSDGVVAVDAAGNTCSLVHTINAAPWGTGLFVRGIALSNAALTQLAPLAATPPGARLTGPIAPVVVRDAAGGASTAAVSVGASLHEVTLQMLNLHLDYAQPANLSVLVPKFLLPTVANATSGGGYPAATIFPAGAFAPDVVAAVEALGQPVVLANASQALGNMGFPVMMARVGAGAYQGYTTQYLNGYAGCVGGKA
jgi:gamma-glutamyltranspeptidase/glutathione hydrolase